MNVDASLPVPFNLTAAIKGKENREQTYYCLWSHYYINILATFSTIDTLLVSDISRPVSFPFKLEEGEYDATLSVSSNITNRVHWSRKTMKLSVKKSTEDELWALKGQVTSLLSQIEELKQTVNDLTSSIAANITSQLVHGERDYDKLPPSSPPLPLPRPPPLCDCY